MASRLTVRKTKLRDVSLRIRLGDGRLTRSSKEGDCHHLHDGSRDKEGGVGHFEVPQSSRRIQRGVDGSSG